MPDRKVSRARAYIAWRSARRAETHGGAKVGFGVFQARQERIVPFIKGRKKFFTRVLGAGRCQAMESLDGY